MKKLILLVSIPVFFFIFLYFCDIPVWDFDFWWHLKTGELIVETQTLPDQDVFTYTSDEEGPRIAPGREKFILKQYWLAQSLMYLIYSKFDFTGIKVMRAAVLTLTLMVFFFTLAGRTSPLISFGFLFLAFDISTQFIGERPQLFSFLFLMLLMVMLERTTRERRYGYFIPPLMLLWANMHGGFILGDLVIAVFVVTENLKSLLKKRPFPKTFNIIAALSVLLSFLNPNYYRVVFEIINLEKYFTGGIQELQSPYTMLFEKTRPLRTSFLFLLGASVLPLIKVFIKRRAGESINWGSYITIYLLMLMSIKTSRYAIFFATAGAWLMALELSYYERYIGRVPVKLRTALTLVAAISVLSFSSYKITRFEFQKVFSPGVYKPLYPFGAVEFIKSSGIKGRIFNDQGWGGFLIWSLYPEKKVFVDTRWLNYKAITKYDLIANADDGTEGEKATWERLLNSYNINFILIPPLNMHGSLIPLVARLYSNDRWPLIYSGYNSLLFARNSEENRELINKYKRPSDDILNVIIMQAAYKTGLSRINPYAPLSLGDAFVKKGRYKDAKKAYALALQRDHDNPRALRALEKLRELEAR